MARQELHSDMLPSIEQSPPIGERRPDEGTIVTGEKIGGNTPYLDELAFMEEPVSIRLEPSSERNAATAYPVWVNGRPADVLVNGAWRQIGYLPVGQVLTVRRSVLEVIIRAKTDTIHTKVREMDGETPNNTIERYTSPVHSFSIIEDRNPRGPAWVAEMRRRYM
jgi:hypothetical protein